MQSHPSDSIKIPPGFWSGLIQLGITAQDIASKANLPLSLITKSEVTTAQYFAIWQAYSDLVGDTAEGIIKLATVFETTQYPPTVLATYHARTNTLGNVQQIIDGMYLDEALTFSEKEKKFMTTNLPQSEIQRFIRPNEIGRLAAFVCSPYASAFKGSPIRMDGGMIPTIF